jgi:hypothetical protein
MKTKSNGTVEFEENDKVVIVGLECSFVIDHYISETNEYQLFIEGQNRSNGKPYQIIFAKAEVIRPNNTLWCTHLGFIKEKEKTLRPANLTRSYTNTHKHTIEKRQAAGMTDELERDICMCIDLASGNGQYNCIYSAMNSEQAELIREYMVKHGYYAIIVGSDVQISW